jgi:hypothetical protein
MSIVVNHSEIAHLYIYKTDCTDFFTQQYLFLTTECIVSSLLRIVLKQQETKQYFNSFILSVYWL